MKMEKLLSALSFLHSKKESENETETETESKPEIKLFRTCLPASREPDFTRWSEYIYKLNNTKNY